MPFSGWRRHRSPGQVSSETWLRWKMVPAVTDVWRPQVTHSKVNGLKFERPDFGPWHFGQTKPLGQRFS